MEIQTDASGQNAHVVGEPCEETESLPVVDLTQAAGHAVHSDLAVISPAVDAWFQEHIHNSPLSRSTEAYNHLVKFLPDLKSRLTEALGT